jgi:hypothetical protein
MVGCPRVTFSLARKYIGTVGVGCERVFDAARALFDIEQGQVASSHPAEEVTTNVALRVSIANSIVSQT